MLSRGLRRTAIHRQRGLSLVELMVGVTIGMFVVAAAALIMSSQVTGNRQMGVEMQIQQDMRATADIMTRELRRTGHWGNAAKGVWSPTNANGVSNPYGNLSLTEDAASSDEVTLDYFRATTDNDVVDAAEQSGFRLAGGAVQMLLGAGNWQTLTDTNTLKVTRLAIQLSSQPVPLVCHADCVDAQCPPQLHVRKLTVQLEGEAARDAAVRRSVSTTVRLPNDTITGSCP